MVNLLDCVCVESAARRVKKLQRATVALLATVCNAKPSQSINWGAETCAKRKSPPPCLLAIAAFDRISRLCNRHLNSKRGLCLR